MSLLIIDNYDSFVHNLARYFERLGVPTEVVRNDAVTPAEVQAMRPIAVVLSPGPCTPDEAGNSLSLVRELYQQFPILGVCLGHQAIAQALGGQVVRAERPWHGRSDKIRHNRTGIFAGLEPELEVGRYHSLVVDAGSLPECLIPTAWSETGEIMALEHRDLPVIGLQFHPESILTQHGYPMLANFLRLAGADMQADCKALGASELLAKQVERPLPQKPVTF